MSRLYSIIISGYKDTVRRTLEACLNLDASEAAAYEVICLDNTRGSRHRTAVEHLFASAPPAALRTVYLPHPVPGKAEAQNRGIREARGQFLVFLDDDVLPERDLVTAYDRAFTEYDCAAVQGRVELCFERPERVPRWLNERFRLDLAEMDFGRVIVPFEMGLTGASMAYRRELFDRYGGFDERLGPGRSGTLEDQEFSERIRARGEVQIFYPGASVKHLIPPGRLKLRSFMGIYFDVGYSDFFLSRDLIVGGRVRFTVYTLRQAAKTMCRFLRELVRRDGAAARLRICECCRHYGYWKQAMRQMG